MADTQQQTQSKFSFLKKSLPWLGTIASIALPQAAPLIAIATKIVGTNLNKAIAPDANSLADVLTAALGDPAQHAQLLAAEQAYQQAMTQLGYQHESDMEDIAEKDRDSARQMQETTRSVFSPLLAGAITLGFFVTLWFVFVHGVKPETHDLAIGMVNVLGTAWVCVVTFYFGGSHGQEKTTELLAQAPAITLK
jgi:hypothetical protein